MQCSFILNKLYNYIFIYSERPSTKHFYLMLRKLNHRLIMIMMNIFIYCFLCFRWTTQAKVRGFLQEQESIGTPDERFWDPELDHTSKLSVWSQYHLRPLSCQDDGLVLKFVTGVLFVMSNDSISMYTEYCINKHKCSYKVSFLIIPKSRNSVRNWILSLNI